MVCPFLSDLFANLYIAYTARFISEGSARCLWSWAAEILGVPVAEIYEGCGSSVIWTNGLCSRIIYIFALEFNKMQLLISPAGKKFSSNPVSCSFGAELVPIFSRNYISSYHYVNSLVNGLFNLWHVWFHNQTSPAFSYIEFKVCLVEKRNRKEWKMWERVC